MLLQGFSWTCKNLIGVRLLSDCQSMLQALDNNTATSGAWDAIHALCFHTYATDLNTIINDTTSLYRQFNKPIWITEIASGSDSSAAANLALMEQFVPWANSQPWIERYFWNQAVSSASAQQASETCQAMQHGIEQCCETKQGTLCRLAT